MADRKPQFAIKAKKPDMWTDRSMTVFANASAEPTDELEANVVITRESMTKTENFKSYIKRQKKVMGEEIPQFDLLEGREGKLKGQAAFDLTCRWMSPAGRVKQRIVFLSVGQGEVITFAATAGVENFDDNMKEFNAILASVEIEELKDE